MKYPILVSGASRGLGRYIAQQLELTDYPVIGFARSHCENLPFTYKKCDITNRLQCAMLTDWVRARHEKVHALINCAAIQSPIGNRIHDPDSVMETFKINMWGVYNIMFHVEPYLVCPKKFILFGGGGQMGPRPYYWPYAASKTGQLRMAQTLAIEHEKDWRVNVVAPGIMHTQMTEQTIQAGPEEVGEKEWRDACEIKAKDNGIRLRRLFDLIKFLVGENSNHVSGQLIPAQFSDWWTKEPYAIANEQA